MKTHRMKTHRLVLLLLAFFTLVSTVAYGLDFGLYVKNGAGDAIHIVDRGSAEYLGEYRIKEGTASTLLPTPGGVSVYVLSANNTQLEVFSAETGLAEVQLSDNWSDIFGLAFTPTGDRLFVLDKGQKSLLVYQHKRRTLKQSGSVDFPVGASGQIEFNNRGTRYFALGEDEGAVLINGDGITGRILGSLKLDFASPPQQLVLSDNDRFAWVASIDQLVVIDLRRNRVIKKIQGNFRPASLVLEKRGKRAIVLGPGSELLVFNNQNGKKLLGVDIPAAYSQLLLDEDDLLWLVPDSTDGPFLTATFKANKSIGTEVVDIAPLPAGMSIARAAMASVKRGGNFACF